MSLLVRLVRHLIGITTDFAVVFLLLLIISVALIWMDQGEKSLRFKREVVVVTTDANALTRGSAVRMLGAQVGSVKEVELHPEDQTVHLTLSLDPKTPPIPEDVKVTIVFFGLGGQKSIELTLPEGSDSQLSSLGKSTPFKVEPPVRMREAMDYQVQTAIALEEGARNTNEFFKRHPVDQLKSQIKTFRAKNSSNGAGF